MRLTLWMNVQRFWDNCLVAMAVGSVATGSVPPNIGDVVREYVREKREERTLVRETESYLLGAIPAQARSVET
jgi:hypothetical protein